MAFAQPRELKTSLSQSLKKHAVPRLLMIVTTVTAIAWSVFPLVWAGVTSLKTGDSIYSEVWPADPTLQNYRLIFQETQLLRNLWNSVLTASLTVLTGTLFSLLAVFAINQSPFPMAKRILLLVLFVSCFPQIALLSGLFQVVNMLGLYNQTGGLVVSYWVLTVPFTTWSLYSFARHIPVHLEEAARIDGASDLQILRMIFFPIMKPGLLSTALLGFVFAWNEFLFAITFTLTDSARTVPVALATLSGGSEFEVPWGTITAASLVVTLPVAVLFLSFQKAILEGLSHTPTTK